MTASVHAGQRMPARELTKRVTEAMRHPAVRALSHPTGRLIGRRPPNALDLEETIAVAVETGVALEVNGLPARLDLRDEHVRLAIGSGARIVVNTDAHSTVGLGNMSLAVATARRGWATAADVVNTRPLDELYAARSRSRHSGSRPRRRSTRSPTGGCVEKSRARPSSANGSIV